MLEDAEVLYNGVGKGVFGLGREGSGLRSEEEMEHILRVGAVIWASEVEPPCAGWAAERACGCE